MREHLIDFLLDAVDNDERASIAQQLERDEGLRRDLDVLQKSLHPLAADQGHHEPPHGLARRCCDFIYSRTEIMPAALSAATAGPATGKRHRWSWLDLTVAGAIAAAVAILMVPAIYQSRLHAQLVGCQNNLKDIGTAVAHYSDRHGFYPEPTPDDRFNAVGTWATKLVDEGDLAPPGRTVLCPSGKLVDDLNFHEPRWDELKRMSPAQLSEIYPRLADYTFNLGFHDGPNGPYKAHRNLRREHFPLSSDPPGKDLTSSPNHGGTGFTVVFEDGHTKYMTTNRIGKDDIFRNANHEVAPASDEDDSVLVLGNTLAK
jgi:hypothetical protein